MSNETILETAQHVGAWLGTFLGGGFVGALVKLHMDTRAAQRQSEIAFLQEQLRLLYGPLDYLTTQAVVCIRARSTADSAYTEAFVKPRRNEDSSTAASAEADATIGMMNAYGGKLPGINRRIVEVLEGNWSLLDEQDREVFITFLMNYTRYQVEIEEKTGQEVGFRVRQQMGSVNYISTEFTNCVTARFQEKRNRLVNLSRSSWLPRWKTTQIKPLSWDNPPAPGKL